MSPNWSIGRTGQVYAAAETSYATAPTFSATNAFRHLNVNLHFDPFSPAKSPERHLHPSQLVLLQRRQAATFDIKAQLYPSGTLNTLPEADVFLANGIGGAASNVTLATTFSGSPTTTTGTVASATGLAVGQFVRIQIASGGNAGVYLRQLTVVAGANLTWAPALPGAPSAGDALAGMVTYTPATAKQKTIDIAHYPQSPSAWKNRELLGCVPNKLSFMCDSNTEVQLQVQGPAQGYAGTQPTWSAQSQPGSYTTVGAEGSIQSGLSMTVTVGGVTYQVTKWQADVDNGYDVQNNASGTYKPVDFFRKNKRAVTMKISSMVSDDLTLFNNSLAPQSTTTSLLVQIGGGLGSSVALAGGKMWAFYAPYVYIDTIPDTPDADADNQWAYAITCLGNAGNDEFVIGQG